MILIPPAIAPELPGAAVEIVHQQSSVVAGSKKFYVAIATTLPTPSLKAPPLNPPGSNALVAIASTKHKAPGVDVQGFHSLC